MGEPTRTAFDRELTDLDDEVVWLAADPRAGALVQVGEARGRLRFYERLGDHAVEIARRTGFVSTGELSPGAETSDANGG